VGGWGERASESARLALGRGLECESFGPLRVTTGKAVRKPGSLSAPRPWQLYFNCFPSNSHMRGLTSLLLLEISMEMLGLGYPIHRGRPREGQGLARST
jgi:hypothetical protein